MAGEWQDVALDNLFKIKHGYAFKGEYFTDAAQPTVLVTPGNFAIGGGFQDGKRKYYSGPVPSDYVLEPGQIVVTMTDLSKQSDTLGYAARIPIDANIWLHNQRVGLIVFNREQSTEPRFVEYLLRSHEYRAWVVGSATGTTVKHTSPSRIESFKTRVPPPAEQCAIAHILGTLDDKIELNRRRNQTLKAMARALFKDWFVDFGPVRAKMEGREAYLPTELWKLFPDRLVESELGEIPAGWFGSTLGSELKKLNGLIQTGPFGSQLHASDYSAEGVPVVMPKDLVERRVSTASVARIPPARTIPLARHRMNEGDIVYSRRGDVERFAVVSQRENGWLCGTGCLLVRPGPNWKSTAFLAETLDHPSTREWIVRHAIGATMPNLNTKILGNVPLLVPTESVLIVFEQLCISWQKSREAADAESETLTQLRDTLLPKLISGELRANNYESDDN